VNWAAAAVVLVLTTSAAVAQEATVLTDSELDAVTAAGVAVDVNSLAAAFGDRTRTLTDADTFTIVGNSFDLGVGLTLGHAYGCCGEQADVVLGSSALGAGEIVRQGTRVLKYDDGYAAEGLSSGYVIALSFKEPLLRQLRPALDEAANSLGMAAKK
jgi:hypothetical protein